MPLRNLTIIIVSAVLSLACYQKAERNRFASTVADAMQLVEDYYVEEVDSHELFENAMNGMVERLDQYSAYIGPEAYKQMEESLDQEFGGVGIEIEKEDDYTPLLVLSPLMGTPAYEAGMQAGDTILEIDGASTIGMSRKDAVALMRGEPGAPVKLLVRHPGQLEPREISIVRRVVVVQSVWGDTRRADGSWDFHLAENPRIGYLRVTTFGKHTVDEFRRILEEENRNPPFEALLMDLRGNAGGLLDAAVETCDAFVDAGRIVNTRGRDGQIRSDYPATKSLLVAKDLPLAILVNKYSASASEIVAACLQDHRRAIVVGQRTWGKGTVQNILDLEGGRSALKLTTASYWRPSGKNIHRQRDVGEDQPWGVRPDEGFDVPLTDEQAGQVALQRRKRDLYQGLVDENPELLQSLQEKFESRQAEDQVEDQVEDQLEDQLEDQPQDSTPSEPFDDPQLRRAVQYLQQQLKQLDAKSRTA